MMYAWFCSYYFAAMQGIKGLCDDWFLRDPYLNSNMIAIHIHGHTAELLCGTMEMKEGVAFIDTCTFPLTPRCVIVGLSCEKIVSVNVSDELHFCKSYTGYSRGSPGLQLQIAGAWLGAPCQCAKHGEEAIPPHAAQASPERKHANKGSKVFEEKAWVVGRSANS